MSDVDVRRAMDDARRRLELVGIPNPARDVSALFLHVAEARVGADETMPADVAEAFERAIARRIRREPVSHIIGRRAFWMHDFLVTRDVLDPRPDTETLVEAALAAPFETVLDLGTGSGCILLSLLHERPQATGQGSDLSEAALDVARQNADRLGVADRVQFTQSDWLSGITGVFDLIVSNPPYITADEMRDLAPEVHDHEPHMALTPGGDGLDAYRKILADAPAHLAPGGRLMVEIGPTQAAAVSDLFQKAGLRNIAVIPDLDQRDRVISGEK